MKLRDLRVGHISNGRTQVFVLQTDEVRSKMSKGMEHQFVDIHRLATLQFALNAIAALPGPSG